MSASDSEPPAPLRVITGPTAAGKSALAMQLARRLDLALMSSDSRQVYRGFDIGTAKPTRADREAVQHYGIDVCDPRERYSAHAWAVDSIAWMKRAQRIGKQALVVGGTGFYIRALVRPLAPAPSLESGRRARLAEWLRAQDGATLRRWCARLDPARATLGRAQLERALETALLAGERLGDVHAAHEREFEAGAAAGLPVRYLVVDPGDALAERIRRRVHDMVNNGWVNEIEELLSSVPATAPAWLASGYDVMRQHVLGTIGRAEAIERVVIETRQYAKRQRTWCRHQLQQGPVTRISPNDPHALDQAIAWWNGTEAH